jgi:Poxvirus A32 protein/Zinc finger, C2H2 type
MDISCKICSTSFSRTDSLLRHMRSKHNRQAHIQDIDGLNLSKTLPMHRYEFEKTNVSPLWTDQNTIRNPIMFEDQCTGSPFMRKDYRHESFDPSLMECEDFDYSLKAPFSMVISGMPQSGKSTLTAKLLERRNEVITTSDGRPINRILYCYTEHQPRFFRELAQRVPEIKFHKGLPSEYADGSDSPSIVVLDDLMNEASKSDDAVAAFTRTSHHRNVCLIMLVQNFFHKNLRNLTSCCHYMCIMKNPRDSSFLSCLGRQMNGGKNYVVLDDAYKDCMKKPYGYVFIDATQQQNDKYRIRDNIFPDDCTVFTKA